MTIRPLARARCKTPAGNQTAHRGGTVQIPPAASTVTGDHKERLRFTVTMGFGLANSEWLLRRRIERAKESLRWGHKLSEVALACGFADESHLTQMLRRVVGATPGKWRTGKGLVPH
ncbi:helix-turn-helix domain-containing protein [Rhizobium leguminosarum]